MADHRLSVPFMDPVALSLGPIDIHWYSLAYLGGLLLGWVILRRTTVWQNKRSPYPITPLHVDDLVTYCTLGTILGGRLGHVLFYDLALLLTPLEIINFWEGGLRGMSFHGGLIGVSLAIVLLAHRRKIPLLALADLCAFVVPIGLGFGRLTNFINGELWGRVSDVPWAVIFTYVGPDPRHPSQIYEALLEGLVLVAVLLVLVLRGWLAKPGRISGVFLLGYALARSFSEFFREPELFSEALAPLTWGMILSLPLAILGLYLLFRKPSRAGP